MMMGVDIAKEGFARTITLSCPETGQSMFLVTRLLSGFKLLADGSDFASWQSIRSMKAPQFSSSFIMSEKDFSSLYMLRVFPNSTQKTLECS